MAKKLTAKGRANLPASKVGYPKSSPVGGKGRNAYPLDTRARARNALARVANPNNAGSYAVIERKVNRLYPDIATKHHKPKRKK